METRKKAYEFSRLRRREGLENVIGVDCEGEERSRSGGLAVLTGNTILAEIASMSQNHIDMIINTKENNDKWRATGFYGCPEAANKHKSWELFNSLSHAYNMPWMIFGDFNQVLQQGDKHGGLPVTYTQTRGFQEALQINELLDLEFVGHAFTWSNNQGGNSNVQERLDRAIANIDWKEAFLHAIVQHLQRYRSDHCPILVDLQGKIERKRRGHIFIFEEVWLGNEGCTEVVKRTWILDSQSMEEKITNCSRTLEEWGKENFGHIPRMIK
ncbi:uncharacterized protein [Arachis hypogaea]|uniref:uncharacterized protein n=1 Tax=Arachis hypogaea TaxID=3818 RepID=UPI003B220CEC